MMMPTYEGEEIIRLSARIAELEAESENKSYRIQQLENDLSAANMVIAYLETKNQRLRDAASAFLRDIEERTSHMEHHPDEAVRDFFDNGKCLPVGDGVLYNLRQALEKET